MVHAVTTAEMVKGEATAPGVRAKPALRSVHPVTAVCPVGLPASVVRPFGQAVAAAVLPAVEPAVFWFAP